MAFDAGTIEARLTIDSSTFDADLDKAKARVKEFEDEKHEIKITAALDKSSVSKARQMFGQLDQAISRDAMSRLRSSPDGSVLGALNALFSPHQVTGAPTPQQAASQGLLGKILQQPGGGGTSGPVSGGSQTNDLSRVLGTNTPGGQGNSTASGGVINEKVNAVGQPGDSTITTTDKVNTQGLPTSGGTITTSDKIKPTLDDTAIKGDAEKAGSDAADAANDGATKEARRRGSGWFSGMLTGLATSAAASIAGALGGKATDDAAKAAKDAGGAAGGNFGKAFSSAAGGILGGIGPTILGLGMKATLITGAIGTALAALPALGGVIGAGLGSALIAGLIAAVVATSPGLKSEFASIGKQAETVMQQAGQAIIPAIQTVLQQVSKLLTAIEPQIAGILKAVAPQLQTVFNGLVPIIKGLLGLMQAAAPAFGPFILSLERLVSSLFPGLIMITKAVVPVMGQFVQIMTLLGSNLGALFGDMAPAVRASMTVLGALLALIGGLLPVIAKLADMFASLLAPIIMQFATAIKALAPAFEAIGTILADLAGAIVGDLAGALTVLAQILTAVAPGLSAFANAIGGVFNVLENTGTFAILGDAIENLAGPIAKLINALLAGLIPILPPIINFVGQLSTLLATTLSNAIVTLMPPLINLVTGVFQVLDAILPVILPLLLDFANVFTTNLVTAISAIATALADIIDAIPPAVLGGIVVGILAIVGAMKAWAIVQGVLDAAVMGNPMGLLITAIALLTVGIVELVTHWTTVWNAIKQAASDVWQFLDTNVIQPMINWFTESLPHAFDLVIGYLKAIFVTPWEVQFNAVWAFLQTIGTDLANFFTKTIPGWFTDAINFLKLVFVTPWEVQFNAVWSFLQTIGTDFTNFFTKTLPSVWDTAISFLNTHFVTPFENGLKAAYNWVVTNVADPIETLFTKTIPGWFSTAVSAIGSFWDKVEGVVLTPVKFVVNDVLNPIGQTFDTVTNALGLGKPIPKLSMSGGGVLPGYGGGDKIPALLEAGETVVDKDKSKKWAWLFKLMGVPGYAAGGIIPVGGGVAGDLLSGVSNAAKIGAALLTGNISALLNSLDGLLKSSGAAGDLGQMLTAMPKQVITDIQDYITGKVSIQGAKSSVGSLVAAGAATALGGGSAATIQNLMQAMAAARGWTGAQWNALNAVEMAEAGYNLNAQNPTSSAYGLAQFINGASEYAQYGGNANTAAGQITAMLNYIAQRYGNPEAAWAHEEAYHWYGNGGPIDEPVLGYGLNSGDRYMLGENGREWVIPDARMGGGQGQVLARLDKLIATTAAVPAGVGRHVGGTLNAAASNASFRSRYPAGGA